MIFYNEIDFRETSLGRVPKNWDVVPTEKLCTKVTDGTHDTPKPADEGYFLVTSKHIKNGRIDFSEAYLISKDDFDETNKRSKVDAYDVLFSMIGTVGLTTVVTTGYPAFAIKNIGLFKTKTDKKLANWLHYYFASSFSQRYIQKNLKGTTQKYIPLYALRKFPIVLPHPSERQRIVEVLSVVDLAIGKVDEVIAKTERLKKGLMQELLTKGMGHKEFKDTRMGKTPKEWQVVRLGEKSVADIVMGQSPPSSTYNKDGLGLPFLQGKMEFGEIFPSPTTYCSKPMKIAESNDVLLSVRAPVGEVNIAPFRCCIGRGLTAIRAKMNNLHNVFLFYYLKSEGRRFESLSTGSTFKAIRKKEIETFSIPLPHLPEQQKIAEILSTVDKKLELEREEKTKLEKIKRGLMDLLLTGKVRVKVD